MDKATLDQRARNAFRRAAPTVDSETFCRVVNNRVGAGKKMRRRPVSRRHVLAACATVLVFAAVSAGAYWALEHHGNSRVLIIGDSASSATQPTPDVKPSSTSGTASAGSSSTLTTFPPPQGVFTWPHSYPGPKYVSNPAARHLADLIVAFLPDVELPIRKAEEIEDSGVFSLSFGSGGHDPWLRCTIFHSPDRTLDPITAERPRTTIDVPGAAEAVLIDGPDEGQWQLLAWLPDNTTINLGSGSLASSGVHTPLVSKNRGERLAEYLAGLLLSGEIALPPATTSTTVPTIRLSSETGRACASAAANFFSDVAFNRQEEVRPASRTGCPEAAGFRLEGRTTGFPGFGDECG